MELPLRDVRGRARRCARATPHAVVAGDPRGRRAVVSRQRLARRAPAARDARAARADGVRAPPIAGVLLTDAEIDHTAGLLLLRESATPVRVFGERGRRARAAARLSRAGDARALLRRRVADAGAGARRGARRVEPDRRAVRGGRRCAALSGRVGHRAAGERVRLPRPRERRRRHLRARARALDDDVLARLRRERPRARRRDVLARRRARRGSASRTAARATWGTCRCRAPAGRSRRSPACERPRKVLVHINNTNPILLEDSPEREAVVRAGVEVAYDGLEVEL